MTSVAGELFHREQDAREPRKCRCRAVSEAECICADELRDRRTELVGLGSPFDPPEAIAVDEYDERNE